MAVLGTQSMPLMCSKTCVDSSLPRQEFGIWNAQVRVTARGERHLRLLTESHFGRVDMVKVCECEDYHMFSGYFANVVMLVDVRWLLQRGGKVQVQVYI